MYKRNIETLIEQRTIMSSAAAATAAVVAVKQETRGRPKKDKNNGTNTADAGATPSTGTATTTTATTTVFTVGTQTEHTKLPALYCWATDGGSKSNHAMIIDQSFLRWRKSSTNSRIAIKW